MRRYWNLIGLFWTTSFAAEMEYRINFVLASLSSLANLVGSIFALSLFYQHGAKLGGWPFDEALLVLGLFTMLQGITQTFFKPNLGRLVEHVRMGTLDFVLLKPVDSQFWLSLRRLSPWGLPDVLFGMGIVLFAGARLNLDGVAWLYALTPISCGVLILYSLWYLLASTTIWYVKIYNVTEVLQSVLAAGRYPIDAFPAGAYRIVFTFVIPVSFLTTVPANALLGRAQTSSVLYAMVFALLLFFLSRAFWRFALRFYTSASS